MDLPLPLWLLVVWAILATTMAGMVLLRRQERVRIGAFLYYELFLGILALLAWDPALPLNLLGRTDVSVNLYTAVDLVGLVGLTACFFLAQKHFELDTRVAQLTREVALQATLPQIREVPLPPPGVPRVVVVIPAHHEADTLGGVLSAIPSLAPAWDLKVVVVDDASSDATSLVAERAGVVTVRHGTNLGIGGVLSTGFLVALQLRPTVVVQMDSDGQHDPQELPRLLAPLAADTADLVIGSRFLQGTPATLSATRRWGVRFYTWVANQMTGYAMTDLTSGFRATRASRLREAMFISESNWTMEAILRASQAHLRVEEVPVTERPRLAGRSQFHYVGLFVVYHFRVLSQIYKARAFRGPSNRWLAPAPEIGLGATARVPPWRQATTGNRPVSGFVGATPRGDAALAVPPADPRGEPGPMGPSRASPGEVPPGYA